MGRNSKKSILLAGCLFITGCMSVPANLLVLPSGYLASREQQMRKFQTTDEKQVLQAGAGALQDLGFTIDKSETNLGVIVASKNRTAVSVSQTALALTADIASALCGAYGNLYAQTDKEQRIEASLVINPSLSQDATVVRVKFQTVVWNRAGQVSRFETIKDPKLYQDFFERISKAVFLEEQKI
ncbi:MAG: hypothetical protein BWY42_00917 [Candidatus Omnitrophica bacterium ADurb.Bin277]|nr:MAG: hypothetical protein BWY42_00917 [Candidatus Omnitrophica bacterium ADurb.Bin277]